MNTNMYMYISGYTRPPEYTVINHNWFDIDVLTAISNDLNYILIILFLVNIKQFKL